MKKALAVASSHYVGIDLPAVSEGYVLRDDEAEAQEELQKLGDAADAPGDALASFFDAEVPPSACKDLGSQGSEALVISYLFFFFVQGPRRGFSFMKLDVEYECLI